MKYDRKPLGEFITPFDNRAKNSEKQFSIDHIVGISSVTKSFVPTKANLVGVTVNSYKIVPPGYFAYNPNTARMGDKVCIGLNQGERDLLVSSIYPVFRITDERLDPEYLLLWFKRSEFDRWARFVSHGSAREVLEWDRFCELEIPVPPISEQRKIVYDYKVINSRIKLLQRINNNYENIEKSILTNALSTQSVNTTELGEIVDFIDGDRGKNYPTFEDFSKEGYCLFLSAANVTPSGFDFTDCVFVTEEKDKEMRKGHLDTNDVVITSRGTLGNVALYDEYVPYSNVRINSGMLILRPKPGTISPYLLFAMMKSNYMSAAIEQFKSGSAQPQLPIKDLQQITFPVVTDEKEINALNRQMRVIQNNISIQGNEINVLKQAQQLLILKAIRDYQ